jgi:hypothetical protein
MPMLLLLITDFSSLLSYSYASQKEGGYADTRQRQLQLAITPRTP